MTDIYDIEIQRTRRSPQKWSDHKGKILRLSIQRPAAASSSISRTAGGLWGAIRRRFEILDFPLQSVWPAKAPGDAAEINNFAALTTERPFLDFLRLMSAALILLHSLTGSKRKGRSSGRKHKVEFLKVSGQSRRNSHQTLLSTNLSPKDRRTHSKAIIILKGRKKQNDLSAATPSSIAWLISLKNKTFWAFKTSCFASSIFQLYYISFIFQQFWGYFLLLFVLS